MEIVDRQLFSECIRTLMAVQERLRDTSAQRLIDNVASGKEDSLGLDLIPENVLSLNLIRDFDSRIVLITEERGEFNFEEISHAEVVVFADPTDRSKHLRNYIQKALDIELIKPGALFGNLLDIDNAHELWQELECDKSNDSSTPASINGACCSLAVVKRGQILFSLCLNYITEELFVAYPDAVGYCNLRDLDERRAGKDPSAFAPIDFYQTTTASKYYATYLGKHYGENLRKTGLIDDTFYPCSREPGGPLRILYLSNINPVPPGFILSNGEKIGEWIGWLAFCRYNEDLTAYSVYPDTFFARDGILSTPSPVYSILETENNSFRINFEKLRYLRNPSRYREMILVTHRRNGIRAQIEAGESRALFEEGRRG